ncbi:MAG: tRNA (adenosine(37)-N6)-threonylcarbamoyltransferase complex dimerization subunit type 1 TsaB [Eubacteriales bacterium]|nr:tRNA (adenosine(37)-N6)-threonylcarbamoyltransferase complex dimerization subunit type 1 TsaB [Eubacteriales bacterium]
MKILAIDTSGIVAGVALIDDNKILGEININHKQNHSITIMPMIDSLFKSLDMEINEIDYIACSCGPGSFTGLRIGASTAKGIAQALNKKIIPISTLEFLAYNIFMTNKYIVPMIDARGERIFTSIYKWKNGKLTNSYEEIGTDIRDFLEYIKENNIEPIFLGDGATAYKEIIKSYDENYVFAPISHNMQKASSLASLALQYAKEGKFIDYKNFQIEYLRKPQAERELLERENKK